MLGRTDECGKERTRSTVHPIDTVLAGCFPSILRYTNIERDRYAAWTRAYTSLGTCDIALCM